MAEIRSGDTSMPLRWAIRVGVRFRHSAPEASFLRDPKTTQTVPPKTASQDPCFLPPPVSQVENINSNGLCSYQGPVCYW